MFLRELRQPVTTLPGIGEVNVKHFSRLGIRYIGELLSHLPRDYEDRKTIVPLASVSDTTVVNTVVSILDFEYFGFGRKKTLKIIVSDDTARASLACFNRNFLAEYVKKDRRYFLYGTFQYKYGELQSSLFELEPWSEHPKGFNRLLSVYPLTEGIGQRLIRKTISRALDIYAGHIEDEIPEHIQRRRGLMKKSDAIRTLHTPSDVASVNLAHRTLAFEELFYLQLITARNTIERKALTKTRFSPGTKLISALRERIPFSLTPDQETVLDEILEDTAGEHPMARLLQGDVGAGKTLIAFMVALGYVEHRGQVAFMAPTELLARQHAENASRLLSPLGVNVAFLSGNLPRERRELLASALQRGDIDILVGTHALFSNDIEFTSLRLVIIDEQHRFGVVQRDALLKKGEHADLLLMTATPIPRTLALTVFGDLDVSTIRTMPPGRKPVITHLAEQGKEKKVYDAVRSELRKGRQAYFVYPLIRESEKLDIKDAESMYAEISGHIFPDVPCGIIHSGIDEITKKETMDSFNNGDIRILVATSVVEVGVDVPNATCMVIEHAERFGLAALHQLRGRVGRAEHQSYAFLVYGKNLTDDAKQRLRVMKNSTDGFFIAEEDLKIRGPGNLAGVQQSGYFRFSFADLSKDADILTEARKEAFDLIRDDPGILKGENAAVRRVLQHCPPFNPEDLKSV